MWRRRAVRLVALFLVRGLHAYEAHTQQGRPADAHRQGRLFHHATSSGALSPLSVRQSASKYDEWPLISNSVIRLVSACARGGSTPPRYVWMTPSLRRTPVPGVWGTKAMGRTLRTLRWSSNMRRARQVATDRRHTLGSAATGRATLSNQNNSVSVRNRLTMPLTLPGVVSEARAITKRKRRLESGMAALKLDSWTHLGERTSRPPARTPSTA